MKVRLPTLFDFDGNDVKVIYLVGSSEPYYSALTVAKALGKKNPSAYVLSTVNAMYDKIEEYARFAGIEPIKNEPVEVANSTRSAHVHISDGTLTILAVQKTCRAATFNYYFNQDAIHEVLFSANGEVALRFRYWLTHQVLPSIRKTGEYIQHRKDGIGLRRELTDAIKRGIDNKELNDSAYPSVTDAVYFIRFGMHAQYLRAALGIGDNENIREHMGQDDLDALAKIERSIGAALDAGMPLSQLLANERLIKLYRRNLI